MKKDRLSGDCSLIPTSYLAHAKELSVVPAREERFPGLVCRVCRPYDAC